MSYKPFLTGILCVVFMASCDQSSLELNFIVPQEFLPNSWIHSFEENCTSRKMNFRPDENAFLESWRLRNRLDLLADGRATYNIGSPKDPHRNDAITSVSGSWTFDPETNTLMILNSGGEIVFTFIVRVLTDDLLILSYKETTDEEEAR